MADEQVRDIIAKSLGGSDPWALAHADAILAEFKAKGWTVCTKHVDLFHYVSYVPVEGDR